MKMKKDKFVFELKCLLNKDCQKKRTERSNFLLVLNYLFFSSFNCLDKSDTWRLNSGSLRKTT